MAFGVTPEGFVRKTFTDILEEVQTRARQEFEAPRLNVVDPKGVLASMYLPIIEQIDGVWGLAEAVYNAPDPDRSTDRSFDIVATLRGVRRKVATPGEHPGMIFTFDGAVVGTIEIGDITINPEGDPDNIWQNSEAVTVGGAGDKLISTESIDAGSGGTFEAGAIVEIITGPSELTAVDVGADDASPGTDLETEEAWRARANAAVQSGGTGPVDAIRQAVEAVDGVIGAKVVSLGGAVQVIVNDGPTPVADDDEIAQAVWDSKCGGTITPDGLSDWGTAEDKFGVAHRVNFDRATVAQLYAAVDVVAPLEASEAEIKEAIISQVPIATGGAIIWAQVIAALLRVDGVEDVPALTIDITTPPLNSGNLVFDVDVAGSLDVADITVTKV